MDTEPTSKNLAGRYGFAPLRWAAVRAALERQPSQVPGSGGPDRHTLWLSTVDGDGRPHVTAVGAYWIGGHYYFHGGAGSRKIRNLERDGRCALAVAVAHYDVVLEGSAIRVTDEELVRRVADVFAAGGWAPTVVDGAFIHDRSATSAGPPPWTVYEFSPRTVYAVATASPGGGATRWQF